MLPDNSFSLAIDHWVDEVIRDGGTIDQAVRIIALELFTRVILRSPVDTGRFRGNWQVMIGDVPDGVLDLTDPSGAATVSKATAEILKLRAGEIITLINNLDYSIRLEDGHSKQAPGGMVKVTILEFDEATKKAATQVYGR